MEVQQSTPAEPVISPLVDTRLRQMAMIAHAAFQAAGFKWYDPAGGPDVVPDVDRMHESLRDLVRQTLRNGPEYSNGTGRFNVFMDEDGDLHVDLEIGGIDSEDLA